MKEISERVPNKLRQRRNIAISGLMFVLLALVILQAPKFFGEARIAEIEDVEVEANSSRNVSFEASNVEEMHYQVSSDRENMPPAWTPLELELYANPSHDMTALTLPPYWQWKFPGARKVEGELLVNTSGAEPGLYNITVEVWNHGLEGHNHEGGASESFQVEVVE